MNSRISVWIVTGLFLAGLQARAVSWRDYTADEVEEMVSAGMAFEYVPDTEATSFTFSWGTYIINTPIMGDMFAGYEDNKAEDANFYVLGMTLRVQPRWLVAPFVGAGGLYHGLSSRKNEFAAIRAESYWSGHAEAGVRVNFQAFYLEGLGRFSSSNAEIGPQDFASWRIAFGYSI